MSSIVIAGDTSGSVTLQAPAVAGSTTITLPATSGTLLQSGTTVTEAQGGIGTTVGYNGFKNRIINGNMRIDQRNAGASYNQVNGQYSLDRWAGNSFDGGAATNKFSVIQSSTAPTGFSNSLLVTSLAATSSGASNIFNIEQKIEGFNFADFLYGTASAQTLTLSFWVRSSLTGTFGGALKNSARNRAYPFTYTISAANTFEQKTITITGDTSGTWVGSTNGTGLWISFGLGVGSTYSGTAGAWGGGDVFSATGATSVVGTNGATWYITGVQLEKGSTATSFDVRPYGTELYLCQRYFQSYAGIGNTRFGIGSCTGTSVTDAPFNFIVPFRTAPSVTLPPTANGGNSITYLTATGNYPTVVGTISASIITVNSCLLGGTGFTGAFVAGNTSQLYASGTCSITASAEL